MEQLKEFQKKIGYQFQQEGLLRQALTHSSYANEHRMKKLSDNERLEFLGDAVLEIVTSDFLYHEHTDVPEGELTRVRASIVCEQTLAFCTRALNLGDYLFLGKGEDQTGGRKRKSILSDGNDNSLASICLCRISYALRMIAGRSGDQSLCALLLRQGARLEISTADLIGTCYLHIFRLEIYFIAGLCTEVITVNQFCLPCDTLYTLCCFFKCI